MAFWALFNSDNEILGTGFNASSALAIAKLRNTSEEKIPDIDDIPKAGLMHTVTELNAGLKGTPYRLERITEDQYFDTENHNNNTEKNRLLYYTETYLKEEMTHKQGKEKRDFMNKIVRKIFEE